MTERAEMQNFSSLSPKFSNVQLFFGVFITILLSANIAGSNVAARYSSQGTVAPISRLEAEKVQNTASKLKLVKTPSVKPQKKATILDVHPPENERGYSASIITGNWVEQCKQWASEAGIPFDSYAIELIDRESDCNPRALNPSSGACGIPQNINGCSTYDPVAQLRWMRSYVQGRYGSWASAVAFHNANGYY